MNRTHQDGSATQATPPWPTRPRGRVSSALEIVWLLLLVLPAATTMSASTNWDLNNRTLFAVSAWLVVGSRLFFPGRAFFAWTLPIALAGSLSMGADFLRDANALELVLLWRTFRPQEIEASLRPYAGHILAGSAAVVFLAACCWRFVRARASSWRSRGLVLAVTAVLALVVPSAAWVRAWPVEGLLAVASAATDSRALSRYMFAATSMANPRDAKASWNASRTPGAPPAETVVFIIGESVRADFLRECHGPALVRAVHADAIVACDVTSGSDATATSVPLLVSREMPGHAVRISSDATFARALEEAGYATHWFGVQGNNEAWSDAQDQAFPIDLGPDGALLLPRLEAALRDPRPLQAVVLHAYNAHEPYCLRFEAAHAPYPASCEPRDMRPDPANFSAIRRNYANAIDASVGFVNDVIARLEARPEPVILVFSPDHAENLFDDGRALYGHERRHPTSWDTHVPAIFWSNAAWRAAYPARWANLQAQAGAPLMQIDLVPTLLSAAGVRYDDPRPLRVDLLTQAVPARRRVVQPALAETLDWNVLVEEARSAGPVAGQHEDPFSSAPSAGCARSTSGSPAPAPASPSPCPRS